MNLEQSIDEAIKLIKKSKHAVAFTGAGISVESGIPPFRGPGGIWEKYDPTLFDIGFFLEHPKKSWELIRKIFFESFGDAKPHAAHTVLAALEKRGTLKAIITQNIDNLHQSAGSTRVIQFHGNSNYFICIDCNKKYELDYITFDKLPPVCEVCGGILKPDFVFFGEPIPQQAHIDSMYEAEHSDLLILVGTTGIIMPASLIPFVAKRNGAKIIEINPNKSQYTDEIVDIFLQGKAKVVFEKIAAKMKLDA
ncbi:MAG: NAD-dependent protein deacylase [Candidatus Lokiarchaeota archaeon]|nr:NAD-dependent protein deacylase [Candidatus Lokiarchaeota archaeon]